MGTPVSGAAAGAILREAATIVEGDRNQTHGDKERSFVAIADFWNVYLSNRPDPHEGISPLDVACMMVLMKLSRSVRGQPIRDHFLDMAGYAAIAGELAEAPPRGSDQDDQDP